jgi:hypothetical protein
MPCEEGDRYARGGASLLNSAWHFVQQHDVVWPLVPKILIADDWQYGQKI